MKRDSIDWKIIDRETISRGGSMEDRSRRGWGEIYGWIESTSVYSGRKLETAYFTGRRKFVVRKIVLEGSSLARGISAATARKGREKSLTQVEPNFPLPLLFRFHSEGKSVKLRSPRAFQWIRERGRLRISIYISLIRGREALFKSSCFLLIFLYG